MIVRTFGLAIFVIVIDQLTKIWAEYAIDPTQPIPVIDGFFNLVLRYNTGAAFSFLADAGGWQRWFFVGIGVVFSVIIVMWLTRLKPHEKLERIGLNLILGGAIGNLIDRVDTGRVVDFIDWYWKDYHWPAFNIADSAILIGLGLVLLAMWREGKSAE